jgi:hypothetical protein
MSAYVVNEEHVNYLVAAAEQFGRTSPIYCGDYRAAGDEKTRVARALMSANIKGVSHCYRGESLESLPGPVDKPDVETMEYRKPKTAIKWQTVIKALDGYEYQSCDAPDFYGSDAFHFCYRLRRRVIDSLPDMYEAEGWSIDE